MDTYNIIKLSHVDSTNDYALSLRSDKIFKEGLVIVSDYQKEGKGQRGSTWESKKGKNLTLSVVLQLDLLINRQFDISRIVSLSIIDVLLLLGVKSTVKWPNDILVGKRKIAGILIQNIISANKITHSVVGIGLNVNQLSFYNYIPEATSLSLELYKKFNIEQIEDQILLSIKNRVESYRLGRGQDVEYLDMLFQKDKIIDFEIKSKRFKGIIKGVTNPGLLIVEIEGQMRNFDLKEIKMIF